MSGKHRIAVGLFLTECNHLGGPSLTLESFERNGIYRGEQMLSERMPPVLDAILQSLRDADRQVVPLIKAEAFCGGPITSSCYAQLRREMLTRLREQTPVDGVILALHGSATADDVGDTEGDLLAGVREIVGPNVPIVATLDCHAHVTEKMVKNANALLAWETYPHEDTFQTGKRGAKMMLDILDGKCNPSMALAKVPVLVSGVNGHTLGPGPFADLMVEAKQLEGKNGVLSTSVFLVHPYLDLPDMGGGALVITDNNPKLARELAEGIAAKYWARRVEFDPKVYTPADAIRHGLSIEGGPVLLVETADCVGGGAAGDSVATLRALLSAELDETALVPVVDPEAAAACHAAGQGKTVRLTLGHKLVPKWGKPLEITGIVDRLSDGKFEYTGGYLAGTKHTMGPSAVVRVGKVHILVMTLPTYDWADEQFASVGLEASKAKFVVVKNPMNFRFGFGALMKAALILDTPGPTPAVLHHVKYKNLKRPYYPADLHVEGLKPTVSVH